MILHIFHLEDGETREEVPMDIMNPQPAEREAERMQANREELVERIARAMREDGTAQPLPGLHLNRLSSPRAPIYGVMEPSVAVIAQGSKEVLLGESRYRYGPSQYLLATVELPTIRRVLEASKERPYLSLRLSLAPTLVGSVMLEAGHSSHSSLPGRADLRGIDVSLLDANLLDAFVRLVRLLDAPAEAPVLLPLITREIIYRLLMGEQGGRLRHLAILGGYTPTIARPADQRVKASAHQCASKALPRSWALASPGWHHTSKASRPLSPLNSRNRCRCREAVL